MLRIPFNGDAPFGAAKKSWNLPAIALQDLKKSVGIDPCLIEAAGGTDLFLEGLNRNLAIVVRDNPKEVFNVPPSVRRLTYGCSCSDCISIALQEVQANGTEAQINFTNELIASINGNVFPSGVGAFGLRYRNHKVNLPEVDWPMDSSGAFPDGTANNPSKIMLVEGKWNTQDDIGLRYGYLKDGFTPFYVLLSAMKVKEVPLAIMADKLTPYVVGVVEQNIKPPDNSVFSMNGLAVPIDSMPTGTGQDMANKMDFSNEFVTWQGVGFKMAYFNYCAIVEIDNIVSIDLRRALYTIARLCKSLEISDRTRLLLALGRNTRVVFYYSDKFKWEMIVEKIGE